MLLLCLFDDSRRGEPFQRGRPGDEGDRGELLPETLSRLSEMQRVCRDAGRPVDEAVELLVLWSSVGSVR